MPVEADFGVGAVAAAGGGAVAELEPVGADEERALEGAADIGDVGVASRFLVGQGLRLG